MCRMETNRGVVASESANVVPSYPLVYPDCTSHYTAQSTKYLIVNG